MWAILGAKNLCDMRTINHNEHEIVKLQVLNLEDVGTYFDTFK